MAFLNYIWMSVNCSPIKNRLLSKFDIQPCKRLKLNIVWVGYVKLCKWFLTICEKNCSDEVRQHVRWCIINPCEVIPALTFKGCSFASFIPRRFICTFPANFLMCTNRKWWGSQKSRCSLVSLQRLLHSYLIFVVTVACHVTSSVVSGISLMRVFVPDALPFIAHVPSTFDLIGWCGGWPSEVYKKWQLRLRRK